MCRLFTVIQFKTFPAGSLFSVTHGLSRSMSLISDAWDFLVIVSLLVSWLDRTVLRQWVLYDSRFLKSSEVCFIPQYV